jgi:hypothetical protein
MLFHGSLFSMALFEASSTESFAEQVFAADLLAVDLHESVAVLVEFSNRAVPESVILRIGAGAVHLKIREA